VDDVSIYFPATVSLSDIARVLADTFEVQDQTGDPNWPQVVVIDPTDRYAVFAREYSAQEALAEGICWPKSPAERFGEFMCVLVGSHNYPLLAKVIGRLAEAWPVLVEDGDYIVFDHSHVVFWARRHRNADCEDIFGGGMLEMPVLETYDCPDDDLGYDKPCRS
jgi:hypothetical protein